MTNEEAIKLVDEFKETGSCYVFDELWASTVMMVNPYKYFDSSGARDEEDFEQLTRIGLWKAIETFDSERGSSILSCISLRMQQALIKELRKMIRESKVGTKISLDSSIYIDNENSGTVEQLIYQSMDEAEAYNRDFNEDLYWKIYAEVEAKVSRNRSLARVFYFKMAFPNASRELISKTFGLSRPCLSTYFNTIKTCIDIASKQYAI